MTGRTYFDKAMTSFDLMPLLMLMIINFVISTVFNLFHYLIKNIFGIKFAKGTFEEFILVRLVYRIRFFFLDCWIQEFGYEPFTSQDSKNTRDSIRTKLNNDETVYLVGITSGTHNAGVALISAHKKDGIKILLNNEEERFTSKKHESGFPANSVNKLVDYLEANNIPQSKIVAVTGGWQFAVYIDSFINAALSNTPFNLPLLLKPEETELFSFSVVLHSPSSLFQKKADDTLSGVSKGLNLGNPRKHKIYTVRHHDAHAYMSYSISPFFQQEKLDGTVTMVLVNDGQGDDCSTSFYVSDPTGSGGLKFLGSNESINDSLGLLYQVISCTQGGWKPLSSEGRYMGATAWGDGVRETNPYYKALRDIVIFKKNGEIQLNEEYAQWHIYGLRDAYTSKLKKILGKPINVTDMWNPDNILNVDNIQHAPITQERCDKAAALQLVFEDCMFYYVRYLIELTKEKFGTASNRLVWTGGCALNCIASMKLMEVFNKEYYKNLENKPTKLLHLWVPPIPSDTGIALGSAIATVLESVKDPISVAPLKHAFYCGDSFNTKQIKAALNNSNPTTSAGDSKRLSYLTFPNIFQSKNHLRKIADLMSYIVSLDGVIGLFQGNSETGPRALGHRTILANPTNKNTLDILNSKVKYRERVRPLAPLMTLEAAMELFHLPDGASDDNYNGFNYMVLAARAKKDSSKIVPAVVHVDGTSRLQIVREELDALTYEYLKANGRRIGVEVSVNTSLNVGTPIVHTPEQALDALQKTGGMHGLLLVSDDGDAFFVWDTEVKKHGDGGVAIQQWIKDFEKDEGSYAKVK